MWKRYKLFLVFWRYVVSFKMCFYFSTKELDSIHLLNKYTHCVSMPAQYYVLGCEDDCFSQDSQERQETLWVQHSAWHFGSQNYIWEINGLINNLCLGIQFRYLELYVYESRKQVKGLSGETLQKGTLLWDCLNQSYFSRMVLQSGSTIMQGHESSNFLWTPPDSWVSVVIV